MRYTAFDCHMCCCYYRGLCAFFQQGGLTFRWMSSEICCFSLHVSDYANTRWLGDTVVSLVLPDNEARRRSSGRSSGASRRPQVVSRDISVELIADTQTARQQYSFNRLLDDYKDRSEVFRAKKFGRIPQPHLLHQHYHYKPVVSDMD